MPPLKVSKKHHKHINNPFSSPPKSLPLIHGSLSFNPNRLSNQQTYQVGEDFSLSWSPKNGGYISISHHSNPSRIIWSTIPGEAFISGAAAETELEESRGSFVIKDADVHFICNQQSIEEVRVFYKSDVDNNTTKNHDLLSLFLKLHGSKEVTDLCKEVTFPVLLITGYVFSKRKAEKSIRRGSYFGGNKCRFVKGGQNKSTNISARYWLLFEQKNKHQVGFYLKFGEPYRQRSMKVSNKVAKGFYSSRWKLVQFRRRRFAFRTNSKTFYPLSSEDEKEEDKNGSIKELNRAFITYSSDKDERFYGFGEQFSHVEFKGKRVPILVQEQGIGRGDQPITFAANLVSYRSGGDWSTTYAPSPFYMTSKMRSLYLEGYNYSIFDLTEHDRVQIQIHGSSARGIIVNGESPTELIEHLTETIGRPPVLPDWIVSGAIIGMQGGTAAVRRIWHELQQHNVPVSAFWLQDWVGQRETIIGSQLWWNWEVDSTRYSGWRQLVDDLHDNGIRVMTYCNPCLVPIEKLKRKRDMLDEAMKLGILVKDDKGDAYMIPNTAFDVGMLDLTHPAAGGWFKMILRDMVECGIRGWMADFGEGLPLDAKLYSGEDQVAAHNRYPELWAKINREFVDEWNSTQRENNKENSEEGLVFFMRAGFRSSPKWAMLFWEGDQMVSWQNNDGIKSSVTGLLSGGLSGFAFNHSDIGGYCTINMPCIKYRRSEELLMRWMELNAFTVVFRTHEGNIPSVNCQFYSNRRTMAHFGRFAKVYMAWKFYRIQLMKEASEKGLPVVRHLFLHYPDDEHVHSLSYQQFLVGTEILVAPVLDKGHKEVKVYFPGARSCWQHIWTGEIFSRPSDYRDKSKQGFECHVDAPIGFPAVFVKFGSIVGENFVNNLKEMGVL